MATAPLHFSEDPYSLIDEIDRIKTAKSHEHSESRTLQQLYYQRPEYSPETLVGSVISFTGLKKLGFSVVGEALDAAVNRVAKEIRTRLITDGGTSSQQRATIAANRIIEGLQKEQNVQVGRALCYDAALNADGYGYSLRYVDAEGNLRLRRLDPYETHITRDGMQATTTLFMSRREAKALYGGTDELDAEIDAAPLEYPEPIPGVDSSSSYDLHPTIAIKLGWVLAAGRQKGRAVVQLNRNTLLYDQEWKIPVLPVERLKVADGFRDGDAKPVGRSLSPYQYWINSLIQKLYIQIQSQVPHIIEEEGTNSKAPSDVTFQRTTYKKGKKPPEIVLPKTVSQDIIQHLDRLHQAAMREIGSTDGSTDVIPPGIKSGLAIQEYRQEVQIRLSGWADGWRNWMERDARLIAFMAPMVYKTKPARVKADNSDLLEQVNWPNIKELSWTVVTQTSGALPNSVPGKLEAFDTFKNAGVGIDGYDVMEAFENPDLKALFAPKLAPRRRVKQMIEKALNDGTVIAPDETQDPQYGMQQAADHYNLAMMNGSHKRNETDALFRLFLLFKERTAGGTPALMPQEPATPALTGAGAPLVPPAVSTETLTPGAPIV
jgi:hypothetical protein